MTSTDCVHWVLTFKNAAGEIRQLESYVLTEKYNKDFEIAGVPDGFSPVSLRVSPKSIPGMAP